MGVPPELKRSESQYRRCYSGPDYPRRRNEADGASGARRGRRGGTPRQPLACNHRGRHGRWLRWNRVGERPDAPRRPGDLRGRRGGMDPPGHAKAVERLLWAGDGGRVEVSTSQRTQAGHVVVPGDRNHVLFGDHRLVLHLALADWDPGVADVRWTVGNAGAEPERAPDPVEYVHAPLQQPD